MTATVRRAPQLPAARPAPAIEPAARPRPTAPELRVVRAPARRRGVMAVAGVALLFGLLFGLVVFHTVLVQNQQRLDRVQREIRTAQAQYETERLAVAELRSPGRIVAEATGRLGMVTPPGTTYLTPSMAAAEAAGTVGHPAGTTSSDDQDWPEIKPLLSEQG